MKNASLLTAAVCFTFSCIHSGSAQDWPQWQGPERNGKAAGFKAPKSWPKELTAKWKTTVGEGDATPALVGDKLFIFSRQEGGEIIRCLDAKTGSEIWKDKYDVLPATGGAASHSGPRANPAVVEGKVVTFGLRGTLSCYDASSGKLLWRKEDFKGVWPQFFTAASPVIVDGRCIAQLGGGNNGGVIAYDLNTGEEKWRWTGGGPTYASPAVATIAGTRIFIAQTDQKIVGLDFKDGKALFEITPPTPGRGNICSSPIVNGDNLIYCPAGRGATAVKIEKNGDTFSTKEIWQNADNSVQYNTPVLNHGALFGLTGNNELFCIKSDGKTAWTAPLAGAPAAPPGPAPAAITNALDGAAAPPAGGGRRGGGGRGGGGGNRGYGHIVNAETVMLALTPSSELVAFEATDKAYAELGRVKVGSSAIYAFPVVSGNRLFIKDQSDVMLYTLE